MAPKPESKQSAKPGFEQYDVAPPSPVELAQIAALVGPRGEPEEALRNGMRLYLQATVFCKVYKDAKKPSDRAYMANADKETKEHFFKVEYEAARREDRLPALTAKKDVPPFPLTRNDDNATLKDFLELVVTIKKKDDALTSLRHFFASQCPNEQDALTYGGEQIAKHTKDGFTPVEWCSIGASYLLWKVNAKSEQGRENRKNK